METIRIRLQNAPILLEVKIISLHFLWSRISHARGLEALSFYHLPRIYANSENKAIFMR